MEKEIEFIKSNTYEKFVDLSRNQKVIGCMWAFKKKEGIPTLEK